MSYDFFPDFDKFIALLKKFKQEQDLHLDNNSYFSEMEMYYKVAYLAISFLHIVTESDKIVYNWPRGIAIQYFKNITKTQ